MFFELNLFIFLINLCNFIKIFHENCVLPFIDIVLKQRLLIKDSVLKINVSVPVIVSGIVVVVLKYHNFADLEVSNEIIQ